MVTLNLKLICFTYVLNTRTNEVKTLEMQSVFSVEQLTPTGLGTNSTRM